MKNILSLIVAVILGIVAVLAVQTYINKMKSRYAENKVLVAVANMKVDENAIITREMVTQQVLDKKGKTDDMVAWEDAGNLINRAVRKGFNQGEIFLWSQIGEAIPKEILAQKVEMGSRALTLNITGIAAVSDMIHPHDQVDLIGTFDIPKVETRAVPLPAGGVGKMDVTTKEQSSFVLLQNVTVLAVGKRYEKEATGGNLTVVVTPEEAIYLIFASQNGKVTAILRNPEDVTDLKGIQVINYEKMLNMAELEGINQKRKQKIIEQIKGGVSKEEVVESE
jgi:pilus assembly protein CpaB